jgi:hypothetical protein
METKCEILDDSEIEELEKNVKKLNFRRFDAAELEKRFSPFDKTQKKEFPFLFQKKSKKEQKISLNDITSNKEDKSLTPPYSPYVDHYDLNDKIVKEEDGKK